MGDVGPFLFSLLPVVTVLAQEPPFFSIKDQAFITECVREHNLHRARVNPAASNMRYMTWDEGLAVTARAWARHCVFKHNTHLSEAGRIHPTFSPVGENIWTGTPYSTFKATSAIKDWADEVKDYSYSSNQCAQQKACGHYTQVVWADSYKVGCAAQACPSGVTSFSHNPGIIFVCNYAMAGNYRGVSPYLTGTICSGCGKESCKDNLCHNSTRDAEISYNWTPDWDPALSSCGPFCVAVLIIRPVSVLLIIVCVYVLQRRYEHLFAYE